THAQVSRGVVLVHDDESTGKRLVGYVRLNEGRTLSTDDLKIFMRSKLPEYMIPPVIIVLQHIPETANGKTDKKELKRVAKDALLQREFIAPQNDIQEKLCSIWKQFFAHERISINDDFFMLGGHSLQTERMAQLLTAAFGVRLQLKDIFNHPTIEQLSSLIAQADPQEPVAKLMRTAQRPAWIPLSLSQHRLWLTHQMSGSTPYHLNAAFRIKGVLDIDALTRAFSIIVERHESLRTVFREVDARPGQVILSAEGLKLDRFQQGKHFTNSEALTNLIDDFIEKPFDLQQDYMVRAALIETGSNDEFLFVLVVHHIASDGWSTSLLLKEWLEGYKALHSGAVPVFNPLPLQYADFSIWQHGQLSGPAYERSVAYWLNKLKDLETLQLPLDYPRPPLQSSAGGVIQFDVDPQLTAALKEISKKQKVTLFVTLLSAFKILLSRYSGQEDICVGCPVAGRTDEQLRDMIGFFANILPFRSAVNENMSFADLQQQIRKVSMEALEHQLVPFEDIVRALGTPPDLSRTPLFQVMFVLQNTPENPVLALEEISITQEYTAYNTAKFDLTLSITEYDDGLKASLEFCSSVFSKNTAEYMVQHFCSMLQAIALNPAEIIAAIPLASHGEQKLLQFFSQGRKWDNDQSVSVNSSINRLKEQERDKPAIIEDNMPLTFADLMTQSGRLAAALSDKGIGNGCIVPVYTKTARMRTIGLLAVLRAGAAYLAIEPGIADERLQFMVQDVHAVIAVGDSESYQTLRDAGVSDVFIPGGDIVEEDTDFTDVGRQRDSLFCIVYTSGSTGNPKGVKLSDANVINRLSWMWNEYPFMSDEISGLKTTVSFVDHIWELFGPLFSGITSIAFSREQLLDTHNFLDQLHQYKVSRLIVVPSLLNAMLHSIRNGATSPQSLRYCTSSGEVLRAETVSSFHELMPGATLLNIYGSTEVTADVTCLELQKESTAGRLKAAEISTGVDQQPESLSTRSGFDPFSADFGNYRSYLRTNEPLRVTIGKPICNTNIYIIDKAGQFSPLNTIGEIYVGGAAVSAGYLNNEELNSHKFLADPFVAGDDARMFKTGDAGRWLSDGTIEFIGRVDNQVKIRGVRIEPQEIQYHVIKSGYASSCVVLAKTNNAGEKILVAYFVPEGTVNRLALFTYLRSHLPEVMIPSILQDVAAIPLTASGKVNTKALIEMETADMMSATSYQAPRNRTEQVLSEIWHDILGHVVGVKDNFFQVGGHSLMATRMVSQIRTRLEAEISIRELFLHPTIESLAMIMQDRMKHDRLPAITVEDPVPQRIPLAFNQERMWFIDQLQGSLQYHMPWVFHVNGSLDVPKLTIAFRKILERHNVLRSVIKDHNGAGFQELLPAEDFLVDLLELSPENNDTSGFHSAVQALVRQPFDLSKDYMLKVTVIPVHQTEFLLVGVMHHIAMDGWSVALMVHELSGFYKQETLGIPAIVKKLPVQYADYAIWQRNFMQGKVLEKKLEFWRGKMEGVVPLNIPADRVRPAYQSTAGGEESMVIGEELFSRLEELCKQEDVTLYMLLLTVFNILLYKYSGQSDFCVGTPVSGRHHEEIENLIGLFVNTIAVRTSIDPDKSFREYLRQTKETVLDCYDHQDVPFEQIVEISNTVRDMSRTPLYQVMFILQNMPMPTRLDFGDLELNRVDIGAVSAKFDLTLEVIQKNKELHVDINYSTDLFDATTVRQMLSHFVTLLSGVVSHSAAGEEIRLHDLSMVSTAEQATLLSLGENSDSAGAAGLQGNVVEAIEEQLYSRGDATALQSEAGSMSYATLEIHSNQLAAWLQQRRWRNHDQRTGIFQLRSIEMVVSILGVLRSGGCYVPLEPSYPDERLKYMLANSGLECVIVDAALKERMQACCEGLDIEVIVYEGWSSSQPLNTSLRELNRADLAYIIYTSGSTGVPKGVMIEHGSLFNRLLWAQQTYQCGFDEVILQKTTYCF
ncbi:MAG: condensation domain-containing protein, partial [Chitinophagaceae bacterium]